MKAGKFIKASDILLFILSILKYIKIAPADLFGQDQFIITIKINLKDKT